MAIKFIKLFLVLFFAIFLMLWVWLFQPYIKYEFMRIGDIEEFHTQYAGWACGGTSPQLTPYKIDEAGVFGYTGDPFLLLLAEGIPSPEDSKAAVPGNEFTLWGYREKLIKTNIITGSKTETITSGLYLVGWEVKVPYDVFDERGQHYPQSEPLKFYVGNSIANTHFTRLSRLEC